MGIVRRDRASIIRSCPAIRDRAPLSISGIDPSPTPIGVASTVFSLSSAHSLFVEMARFIDLEDEDSGAPQDAASRVEQHIRNAVANLPSKPDQGSSRDDDVPPENQRPRISNAITRAF